MLASDRAFSGFAVDDIDAARAFYGEVLGIGVETVDEEAGLIRLDVGGCDPGVFVYAKPDHRPATYTILNFPVDDVEQAVGELAARGVAFERYEGFDQDERGIARGMGPAIAWFRDPAGNILAVPEEPA
jgi:catechol 2,3-dioxygenase-like lactoylglutathione lyase family enzyme